jgi:hypothetical protein
MKSAVSRVSTVAAIGLALGACLASNRTLQARQDAPAQQAAAPAAPQEQDLLKFTTNAPVLLINAIKPDKVADFEAGWAMIKKEFAKTDRPEVKEFAATLDKFYKVTALPGAAATNPVIYVFQVDSPSTTQSYMPGKIVYEFLYFIKDGKEGGIPRPLADEIFAKLKDCYVQLAPWPLVKMGS